MSELVEGSDWRVGSKRAKTAISGHWRVGKNAVYMGYAGAIQSGKTQADLCHCVGTAEIRVYGYSWSNLRAKYDGSRRYTD